MKTNHVRAKLKRNEPSYGTWLTLPDPFAARYMARVGFDWLTVELEHTPTTLETAALSFAAIMSEGCAPFVRVPSTRADIIKRVLDMGAWGLVIPMVNSRNEAEAAVAAARYAPLGNRPIGGQLHAANFDTDPATYYQRANDEILVIIMAEHVIAIEKADEILSVPGIDAVFIGPNDLHHSMGKKPAFESDHKEYTDALRHVLKSAEKYGIAPGIHVIDAEAAQRHTGMGFRFIAITSETGMMISKAREIASTLGISKGQTVVKY
jgi:4-hydroxy-2-oxoheptanedioate aldolase